MPSVAPTQTGNNHNHTFDRAEIINLLQGRFELVDAYDFADLTRDPKDEETRETIENIIDMVCNRGKDLADYPKFQRRAAVLKQRLAEVGTHPATRIHPRAVTVGRRHGLDLGATTTADVRDVARPGDLLVAVCDNAHEELPPGQSQLHWAVPDPVRVDTEAAFETAYAQITQRVERLAHAFNDESPRST